MIDFLVNMPTWNLIRIFGIASYLCLFLGMVLGISYSFPSLKSKRAQLLKWHTGTNITGTLLALLHAMLLIIDVYMPFSWMDIIVPFHASNSTVLNALGTIAFYGLIVVLLTSDLRNKLGRKVWLAFHFLSYPLFVLALIHGLFEGTDSSNILIKLMYYVSAAVLVGLTVARATESRGKTKVSVGPVKHVKNV
ncbi:ferric reductase-like transmembrane domain-containing protein [Paenibacillus hexagrammi]|uniref:Ferric reductase-like transmembrane domain-containing protein n=1 Tax=Paenibacillus hexagrammi TaxID=2908839 RepID=A0ABY3SNL3_9BACL|nr:ferric reductase-like transmembrane domain-containing protein [Paenibacillus sp. YPD9-1]UJF34720.1 ferric reductase-like transmembrane domain-containing protein [Paenibacillus sp. YPD9-1]